MNVLQKSYSNNAWHLFLGDVSQTVMSCKWQEFLRVSDR